MNVFVKQLTRSRLFTAWIILLLTIAIALGCIAVSAQASASEQLAYVDGLYTSVAVAAPSQNGGLYGWDVTFPHDLRVVLDRCPLHLTYDQRYLLGATVTGTTSLTSRSFDPMSYIQELDTPYAHTVLAVRCRSVDTMDIKYPKDGILPDPDKQADPTLYEHRTSPTYFFDVEEVLSMMERDSFFPKLTSGRIYDVYQPDGTPLMEPDKTYLIRVKYTDSLETAEGPRPGTMVPYQDGHYEFFSEELVFSKSGKYWYQPTNRLPICEEYTGEVHQWLDSSAGIRWRDEIIPAVERDHASVKLMLTDCLDSIYAFNTKETSVLEGRAFTQQEYGTGADVCLVSTDYARLNGLQLGDHLHMDLYAPEQVSSWMFSGYSPENDMGIAKDYTIVGIYTTPGFAMLPYAINPDTVLVPKDSVPGAKTYARGQEGYLSLVSVILQNGLSGDLEAYLKTQGMDGKLQYFDQGYNKITGSLYATADSARRLLIIGGGIFLLAAILSAFLLARKLHPTVRNMRLLGVSAIRVYGQSLTAMAGASVLSVLLGTGAAWVLFDRVCRLLNLSTLRLDGSRMLWAGGGQFAFLLILYAVSGCISSVCPLMKKGGQQIW